MFVRTVDERTIDVPAQDNLLARLAGHDCSPGGPDPWASLAATRPEHDAPTIEATLAEEDETPESIENDTDKQAELDRLCSRIATLAAGKTDAPTSTSEESGPADDFIPLEPESLEDAQLTESDLESLILKYLLNRGESSGRQTCDQLKLPYKMIEAVLRQMKTDQLVVYKGAAQVGDYIYQITDMGRERARRHFEHCTYFGAAPVSLKDYIASVHAQSMVKQHPTVDDLRRAFSDLLLNQRMLNRLGPAINSGRGLFLYGAPGNGKTSIAERVTNAFGQSIWIPRALGVGGEIIRLYDPSSHEEMPLKMVEGLLDARRVDRRWIRIRRPTIVVGGELTMDNLEVTVNPSTRISEAPLQMKSNCGTLVIDDFGRQRIKTDELLNRWIVPLEKRYDFLNLSNGKKIQVPFDQLIIFSTNLEPKDLVDDAFLRRIPYKIDARSGEAEFRELFRIMAPKLGFLYREEPVDYLIEKHYKSVRRPFRCCQPRDLLLQVRNFCYYQDQSPEMTKENFDFAVENYFAVM